MTCDHLEHFMLGGKWRVGRRVHPLTSAIVWERCEPQKASKSKPK